MTSQPALTDLNSDAMFNILSFLSASDIESGPRLVSKQLCNECSSDKLWKSLCESHGKRKEILLDQKKFAGQSYYDLYRQIPCVPEDFPTITQALDFCEPGSTITLLPGTYNERIEVSKSAKICAADPQKGAAIMWYRKESFRKDQCAVEVEDSCELFVLQDLTILQFSRGSNIWNGNCAVYCNGPDTDLQIQGCSIQSDSGKGICVVGGGSLRLKDSSVHDCAATGVYVAGGDTVCEISNCNILRNGFGTRTGPYEGISQIVPPGHSGVFVEVSDAHISNNLIACNSMNGMSIIQKGPVRISGCDFGGNGQAPIVISNDPLETEQGAVYERDNSFHDGEVEQLQHHDSMTIRCSHVQHELLTLFKVNEAAVSRSAAESFATTTHHHRHNHRSVRLF